MKKHEWLKLTSERTQPYTIDDISVIIPSVKNVFKRRLEWFWPQYIDKTHPDIVKRTYFPCDPGEEVPINPIETEPKWIVPKTIAALDKITTRLTFRLANDIMMVRDNWWEPLLKQFNDQEKLQIIGEIQNGTTFPKSLEALQRDWEYLRREYPRATTAAVYPHGSRIFAQTAVWNGYYRQVLRYTPHDHDELFFSQLARGDGICFTKFSGIERWLKHCGISNKDFDDDWIAQKEKERKHWESFEPVASFIIL